MYNLYMDYLTDFLEQLSKDGKYYAQKVENVAEIYTANNTALPACLIELKDDDMYHINFRCDLKSREAAQLMYDMSQIDSDIIVCDDFIYHQEQGLLYGEHAMACYYSTIYNYVGFLNQPDESSLEEAVFISDEPIPTTFNKNKTQRNRKRFGLNSDDLF